MVIVGQFERVRPARGSVSLGWAHTLPVTGMPMAGLPSCCHHRVVRYVPHSSHSPGGKHGDQAFITKCSLVKVLLG